jgi:hypothetical protein
MAQRRIAREAADLQKLEGVQMLRDESDPLKQTLIIDPPTGRRTLHPLLGDLFFGVRLELVISYPPDYPFRSFTVEFAPAFVDRVRNQRTAGGERVDPHNGSNSISTEFIIVQCLTLPTDEADARKIIADEEMRHWDNLQRLFNASGEAEDRVVRVVVKMLTGRTSELDVTIRTSVRDVHAMIGDGISRQFPFRLIVNKSAPDYDKCVGDYMSGSETTLHVYLVHKLTCGCPTLLGRTCRSDDWNPARTLPATLLQHPPHREVFVPTGRGSSMLRGLEALTQRCRSEGEMQWMLRAASPAPNVVWSPETDADWPMFFRRTVRLLRFVAVSHPCGVMPVEVVANVVEFL